MQLVDQALECEVRLRIERLLDSLCLEIQDAATTVRARRVFETPREIFRLEIQSPDLGYQRTTLLDRDALEELLAIDAVRSRLQLDVGRDIE